MFEPVKSASDSAWVRPPAPAVQRKCACGQHTVAGRECEACRRRRLQAGPSVNAPGDRFEQEADRMAAAVVDGGHAPSLSPAGAAVQRQEKPPAPKSNEEKMKEAAQKAGEAFMKTAPGQEIEKKAKALGESFVSTLPGQVITGTAVVGVLATLVATNSELPMQLPAIPLDKITPGLSMKITWEGPVRTPKAGAISFTYKFGAGREKQREKPQQTRAEKQRADNARMALELQQFREGLKTPAQRAAEQQQMMDALARMRASDPLNPLNIPGLKPRSQALPLLPRREKDEEPVQRKAKPGAAPPGRVPPGVQETIRGGGQPLDQATRAVMESRFGRDFSGVRVHTGEQAARSATALSAEAYTVGRHIVFGSGQYRPQARTGQLLLAHELTHVVQQDAAGAAGYAHPWPAAGRPALPAPATTAPALQRKLKLDTTPPPDQPDLSFVNAIQRLTGQTVKQEEDGVHLDAGNGAGGSPTIAGIVKRAIASEHTYHLRWGTAAPAGGGPAPTAAITQENGDIQVRIAPAHVGEFIYTLDELVAENLVRAVTQYDPSPALAPSAKDAAKLAPLPDIRQDELLTGESDPDKQPELQGRLKALIQDDLAHLNPGQKNLVYQAGWRSSGVPLSEILRGIETNTPFRFRQEIKDGRVTIETVDPRAWPADADQLTTGEATQLFQSLQRKVTFVPGQSGMAAGPAPLPQSGETCSDEEQASPRNSCCTPAMLAEFDQHIATARRYAQRAIARLEGDELIDCTARSHFRTFASRKNYPLIADRLRLALSELDISRHGWICRPRGSGQAGCEARTVDNKKGFVGGAVRPMQRNILICTNKSAPYTEWDTVLHETMHRVGVSGEETYIGDSRYPGSSPLDNADSYAQLAAALGAPDWEACAPRPIDTQVTLGSNLGQGFVIGARFEVSPLGPGVRVVDWTAGLNFFWSPKFGIVPEAGDDRQYVLNRGYVGGSTGLRFQVPRQKGTLVFDTAVGLGALWSGDGPPDAAISGRAAARWRFGNKPSGPEIGLDFNRLQSLTEKANGEWVIGVTAGFHFGRETRRKPRP